MKVCVGPCDISFIICPRTGRSVLIFHMGQFCADYKPSAQEIQRQSRCLFVHCMSFFPLFQFNSQSHFQFGLVISVSFYLCIMCILGFCGLFCSVSLQCSRVPVLLTCLTCPSLSLVFFQLIISFPVPRVFPLVNHTCVSLPHSICTSSPR